jgi:hypothetical protein
MKRGLPIIVSVAALFLFLASPMYALGAMELKENAAGPLQSSSKPPVDNPTSGKARSENERFILVANLDAYFSYSDIENDDDLWGGGINATLAPAYRINDRLFALVMYDGNYYKRREFYSDEFGYRQRTEFQGHTVTPMLRIDFGEKSRYSLTPSVFGTWTYNKDGGENSDNDDWNNGLYNYEDLGGGLDFDMREVFGEYGSFKLGVQHYTREYPNYQSLASMINIPGQPDEKDEKDYHGTIFKVGYKWLKDYGWSWTTELSLLYKDLDDKKVIQLSGLSNTAQEDLVTSMNVNGWYLFENLGGGFRVGVELDGGRYDSNQNYYDLVGAIPNENTVFIDNFYDYYAYTVRPYISYTFDMLPLTPAFSYAYRRIDYTDRLARDVNGLYTSDKQWEALHETVLSLRFDLTDQLSLMGWWQHQKARSNNEYQDVYRYDYVVDNISIGVSFRY